MAVAAALVVLAGCGSSQQATPPPPTMDVAVHEWDVRYGDLLDDLVALVEGVTDGLTECRDVALAWRRGGHDLPPVPDAELQRQVVQVIDDLDAALETCAAAPADDPSGLAAMDRVEGDLKVVADRIERA